MANEFSVIKSRQILRKRKDTFPADEYNLLMRTASMSLVDLKTGLYKGEVVEYFYNNYIYQKKAGNIGHDREIGLIYLDLDNFKNVNDRYGHSKGDEILGKVGEVIRENIRSRDLAARVGGDEFVVLLVGTSGHDSTNVVRRLRDAISNHDFIKQYDVGASAGLAKSNNGDGFDLVKKRADAAMYHAKNNGKNMCAVSEYDGALGLIF